MLVCTRGAAFEMDCWKFGGVSVDTTILNTLLSAPTCTAYNDMVYSKELERDVTTTVMAKAILVHNCLQRLLAGNRQQTN